MGYYGLGPGLRTAEKKTPLEEALRSMDMQVWLKTLLVMETLLKNVSQNHKEDRFRKIRLTNAKINDTITSVPGAVNALIIMGWKFEMVDGTDACLTLPADIRMTFPDHVNKVIDARDFYKKEEDKERVSKGMSRAMGGNSPKDYKCLYEDKRSDEEKQQQGNVAIDILKRGGDYIPVPGVAQEM